MKNSKLVYFCYNYLIMRRTLNLW